MKTEQFKQIEHAIGEVFEYHGMNLKVFEGTPCAGCVFRDPHVDCFDNDSLLVCNGGERKDGKNVIFKSVDGTEEYQCEERIKKPAGIEVERGKAIPAALYERLDYLGIIPNEARAHNVDTSDYAKHTIQPWSIWLDYPDLTSWDHDIIKRVLRTKEGNLRELDYEKIIHICQERIRQIKTKNNKL